MERTTTQWATKPVDNADLAYLLRLLFSEPTSTQQDQTPPTCGLDAAFERIDRHLVWFQADAEREVA